MDNNGSNYFNVIGKPSNFSSSFKPKQNLESYNWVCINDTIR